MIHVKPQEADKDMRIHVKGGIRMNRDLAARVALL